jgi:hypothetical protein
MAWKCMIKLMLVMMESIVLIIFEVHANDLTPLSFAPTPLQLTFIHSILMMRIYLYRPLH